MIVHSAARDRCGTVYTLATAGLFGAGAPGAKLPHKDVPRVHWQVRWPSPGHASAGRSITTSRGGFRRPTPCRLPRSRVWWPACSTSRSASGLGAALPGTRGVLLAGLLGVAS